jgi:Holliday junction resolvasome RuvABC endonuclease subunit
VISLGVDASKKATGLVVLEATGTKVPALLLEESVSFANLDGVAKYRAITTRIIEVIDQHKPNRIVLEGYSLNMKHATSVIPLVELGGMIRFMFVLDGHRWLDPRAGELKKFVTGKGGTPKDQMMMYVLHRWGHVSKSNDTADGYGLSCMGLAHANKLPGITEEMRRVVGSLKFRDN